MGRITVTSSVLAAFVLAGIASVLGASVCLGEDTLFADAFKTADPGWGEGELLRIADGKLTLQAPPDSSNAYLYEGNVLGDMTCSIKVRLAAGYANDGHHGGLLFWAKNYDDYYILEATADGHYDVCHRMRKSDRWLYPVSSRAFPDLKKGAGEWNLLAVVIQGDKATIKLNGKEAVAIKGQPPEDGSLIGVFGDAGKTKQVWEFSDLKVTKVGSEPQASPPPTPPSSPDAPSVPQPKPEVAPPGAEPAPPKPAGSATSPQPQPLAAGFTVALGDPLDSVKKAYPDATDAGAASLAMPGVRFFFTEDKLLYEIMVEAPYEGSIEGIKIGDTADDVVARRGEPNSITSVFGGSGYLYRVGGHILRYDVDEKSKKVTDIVQILSSPIQNGKGQK